MPKNIFAHDNVVKWCPGCGDYAVLKHLQQALSKANLSTEQVAIVSGIGCSSRLPHYVRSFGFHTVHGRAPTVLTGLVRSRPDLTTLLITGDGDGLSIGLSHLLHLIRRQVNTTVLLLNNKIYGLTKGQNSPTTQKGLKTKMTPQGHEDRPLDLASLVLAAGGDFFGRCYDTSGLLMQDLLAASFAHQGCSVIEVYQSCPIFNKGAFLASDKKIQSDQQVAQVWPGKPIYLQDKPLHFDLGQWQESSTPQDYHPDKISKWALAQEDFLSMGLLWAPEECLSLEEEESAGSQSSDRTEGFKAQGHPADLTPEDCEEILKSL